MQEVNDSDTQINRPKQLEGKLSGMANAIHLVESPKLSSNVFRLLLLQYQIPHTWYLLRNLLQLSPVHQSGWIGALCVGVTNYQCLPKEERNSKGHLSAQKKSRRHLPARKLRRISITIHRGLCTYLCHQKEHVSVSINQSVKQINRSSSYTAEDISNTV